MGSYTKRFRLFIASVLTLGFLVAGASAASAADAEISAAPTAAAGRLCIRSVPLNLDFCLLP